jgi:hypothetical protein
LDVNNPDRDDASDKYMFETLDRLAKKRRAALGLPEPEPKPAPDPASTSD